MPATRHFHIVALFCALAAAGLGIRTIRGGTSTDSSQRPAGFTNVSMFDEYAKGARGSLPFSAARTGNVREQLTKLP